MIIAIRPSPSADTRTCDVSTVSKETLESSTKMHQQDVRQGLDMFQTMLGQAAHDHDMTKMSRMDLFFADFQTKFEKHAWWDMHRMAERHHLGSPDGVPLDVNLVDVLEYVTDCVMAGMARSGSVRIITIDADVLQRAFNNTAALLASRVVVVDPLRQTLGARVEVPPLSGSMSKSLDLGCGSGT